MWQIARPRRDQLICTARNNSHFDQFASSLRRNQIMKYKLLSLVLASAVALSSASAFAANSSKQTKQTHHNSSNSMNMMKGQSHTSPGGSASHTTTGRSKSGGGKY
jgi:hypothetical protein